HMHRYVDIGQGLRHDTIHHAVHGAAVTRLESGRIDKHKLLVLARQYAVYAVPGSLGLARNNRDLAADERIGQGRLADVRASDHGDKATAKRSGHFFSWETATGRESWVDLRARALRWPLACGMALMAAM